MNPKSLLAQGLAYRSYRHEVPARAAKYAKLTGHIKDAADRRITEVLCEQQLDHIQGMDEATSTGDVALFKKFALRVIPRVYPQMFVKNLVSVQPIPLPTAKVFYKDFLRDPAGTRLDDTGSFSRTYANRGDSSVQQPVATPPASSGPTLVTTNEGTAPAKIKMTLTAADISADSKALQYEFSAELNQDLMAYHGISADAELGAEAASEIQREIEYDIIETLMAEAGAGNVNWSATPPAGDQGTTLNTNAYNATIFHAISDARNLVFKKRYAYPNWMVCHPDFAVRLEKLAGFEYDPSFNASQVMQGRQFFGTLRRQIQVMVDPWVIKANRTSKLVWYIPPIFHSMRLNNSRILQLCRLLVRCSLGNASVCWSRISTRQSL